MKNLFASMGGAASYAGIHKYTEHNSDGIGICIIATIALAVLYAVWDYLPDD